MSKRKWAKGKFGQEWLNVTYLRQTCGRITIMANRNMPFQAFERRRAGAEIFTDLTNAPQDIKFIAIIGYHAGCFLTAMLQSMQAKCGKNMSFFRSKNAKYGTFFLESICVGFKGLCGDIWCHCLGLICEGLLALIFFQAKRIFDNIGAFIYHFSCCLSKLITLRQTWQTYTAELL